jgi:hypothetical protein
MQHPLGQREPAGADGSDFFGLLTHVGTNNLGDEIQSLAARRFLPRVDRMIPREDLPSDPGVEGRIRVILNGWFLHNPRRWPPHEKIVPLLTSIHLAQHRSRRWAWLPSPAKILLARKNIDYLRRHGPIGARDRATLALLQRHDVASYYSGCVTLTLPPREEAARSDHVVACDLDPELLHALAQRTHKRPLVTTHLDPVTAEATERLRKAEALLKLYAEAKSVVTSRLHCALPCLALGTPVLFIPVTAKRDLYRQAPALELANHCSRSDFLARRGSFDPEDPPSNPTTYRSLVADIARRCQAFADGGFVRSRNPVPGSAVSCPSDAPGPPTTAPG